MHRLIYGIDVTTGYFFTILDLFDYIAKHKPL